MPMVNDESPLKTEASTFNFGQPVGGGIQRIHSYAPDLGSRVLKEDFHFIASCHSLIVLELISIMIARVMVLLSQIF